MANSQSIENNFIAGLKTEFTALNFPAHAATDTDNCFYDVKGNVTRRLGFDYEVNRGAVNHGVSGNSISSYIWKNAGGDGLTMLYVEQIGNYLYFYEASAATTAAPLSTKNIGNIDFSGYKVSGSAYTVSNQECQYADGNGYLFVYHPYCEPFYVSFNPDTDALASSIINLQIRDFAGIPDLLDITTRPSSLSTAHSYNLTNQGWVSTPTWAGTDTTSTVLMALGARSFTIATGLTITVGQQVKVYYNTWTYPSSPVLYGVVASYNSGSGALVITVQLVEPLVGGVTFTAGTVGIYGTTQFTINPYNTGYITDFYTSQGIYPSNADVWWYFKDDTNTFDPTEMVPKVTQNSGYAPKGHNILSAFNQIRGNGITTVTTTLRPKTGCWFQGRVWYAGTDSSYASSATSHYMNWSETIYFSQIVNEPSQFGMAYQVNDPTSEELFNLLPTDGGTIQIQGCGGIYKLFPIQNGLIVFAANGIWFITGSQGIGFAANDYTITRISDVQALSGQSFVNVQGLPVFWNEEGIYTLQPAQQGLGLTTENIASSTIASFYSEIPKLSKKYARGSYNPIDYIIQWVYKSEPEASISDRYDFDRVLCYNIQNKAFYPYTISTGVSLPKVRDVMFVDTPGGDNTYPSMFKYWTTYSGNQNTFSEERRDDYVDWYIYDTAGTNYDSYFITGYSLKGSASKRFQPVYVYMYSVGEEPTAYKIQGIWDFADEDALGRRSIEQTAWNNLSRFGTVFRRHKIRGHGLSLQIKVTSVDGLPFDVIGWAVPEQINTGV